MGFFGPQDPQLITTSFFLIIPLLFKNEKVYQSFNLRNLNEFPITETELKLIAVPAITGLKSKPKNGYSAPAAIGTPRAL